MVCQTPMWLRSCTYEITCHLSNKTIDKCMQLDTYMTAFVHVHMLMPYIFKRCTYNRDTLACIIKIIIY